ncbi:MAG: pelota family protein [Thaumarchaeota archaeon]|nr:pelota family protein [Nitrososphaerota archaeon]
MIVKRVDERRRSVTLIPESGLDLINLFRVVEAGDVLYSKTSRELKKERASGKMDSERVQVVLGIEVESKSADPLMKRVRFTGRIVYESKKLDLIGKYHSITLYPGAEITIQSKREFQRLKSFSSGFRRGKKPFKVLCVSVDDEEIAVAEFSNRGLDIVYSKHLPKVDKSVSWSGPPEDVFEEAVKAIKNKVAEDRDLGIAVFGPKIFLESFMKYLGKRDKSLLSRVKASQSTSVGGESGFREILRSGSAPEFIRELKPFRDALEVEYFIEVMSRDPSRVAVGLEEVHQAWKLGAVERVLVAEQYLWNNLENEVLEEILEAAERGKIDLRVLLDGLESSDKVMGMGGIVAVLRYPLPLKEIGSAGGG